MGFIIAQILGAVALILVCIGYFLKDKSVFMIIQAVSNIFYASAFFAVEAYVGACIVLVSVFRCIYIYFAEKKEFKYKFHLLPVFVGLYVVVLFVFYKSYYDIIPLCTATIFTFVLAIKNMKLMRYILIIPNAVLVLYNILTKTYFNALLDFIEVFVLIIAIIKHNKFSKKNI